MRSNVPRPNSVPTMVRAFYESLPYPSFEHIIRDSDSIHLTRFGVRGTLFASPRTILSAGCGTTEPVELALSFPSAVIIGIDLSQRSLDIASDLASRFGVTNLRLRQMDIRDVRTLQTEFDLICCYGVIHHVERPDEALRSLAGVLSPEGIIHLMVYSKRCRYWIEELRAYLRAIGFSFTRTLDAEVTNAMMDQLSLLQHIERPENRLRQPLIDLLRRVRTDRHYAEVFDALLHPQVVTYDLRELLELASGNGLEFIRFSNECEWNWRSYCGDLNPPWHKDATYFDRVAIMDILFSPAYFAYLRRSGSNRSLPADRDGWRDLSGCRLAIHQLQVSPIQRVDFRSVPLVIEQTDRGTFFVKMQLGPCNSVVHSTFPWVQELVSLIDGSRTFLDIVEQLPSVVSQSLSHCTISTVVEDLVLGRIVVMEQ